MNQEDSATLRKVLEQRVLAAGVLVDGAPYVGLLPFALAPDCRAVYVHVSSLARHTEGLTDGAPFSALLHAPDDPSADPLQVPRLTLLGTARVLARGTPEREPAQATYLARFPDSEVTFELADFQLVELLIREGRFVVGFANARDVTVSDLRAAMKGG